MNAYAAVAEQSEQYSFRHGGSYMGAHVLLNLLNELGKISFFRNEFNKFNNK